MHTHICLCNALLLMWGFLRVAPTRLANGYIISPLWWSEKIFPCTWWSVFVSIFKHRGGWSVEIGDACRIAINATWWVTPLPLHRTTSGKQEHNTTKRFSSVVIAIMTKVKSTCLKASCPLYKQLVSVISLYCDKCSWFFFNINLWLHNRSVHNPLTSARWVHSNVYVLGNIHCIRYLTAVDPFHSTSSAGQMYHHLTSGSVEIPLITWTGNSSSIGKEPVS